jgi:RNA polymerase sigma-70 factor, ECF subfamily
VLVTSPPLPVAVDLRPDQLFSQHATYVWRVVRYLGVVEREVEDVAQEVFVHAFAKIGQYDPGRASQRTWLYGFCLRVVANHRRLVRHARESLDGDLSARALERDEEGRLADRAALLYALDSLTDEQRAVTVLHAVEEMPMPEVARLLEIPLQTAYSRYEAARKRMREALARERSAIGGPRG